ncbi:hypothetical protein EDD70_1076 [Hydrogenoanaerobacterium saccharovorans]|uniref:Phage tail assembly chaperone protein, E, or 41 or 14 n=1 Tax=Hydrogenoanaerobacterium saccharovorans TaxID=474960 RepID=A0A1H7ZZV8_9FIRM|nr:hypothetical protein [Hydrogenoanaerobacterium saccharovorans]RPF48261.1 hypothetical protein EDD70_1076 [Hydrogenoanaerobacterium saccharovorans]SEM63861.1 hypothetical protein SAMN05216180_1015 [Hydrogenoanaerobacterium saccharovorans]
MNEQSKSALTNKRDGVYVHTFEKPFEYEEKQYTDMVFDFNKLTGRDMLDIEAEMQAQQDYVIAPEISRNFQAKMAAKAGKIGSDVLEQTPMKDFNRITNAARDFLISTGY